MKRQLVTSSAKRNPRRPFAVGVGGIFFATARGASDDCANGGTLVRRCEIVTDLSVERKQGPLLVLDAFALLRSSVYGSFAC